jgi:hypothetical protein
MHLVSRLMTRDMLRLLVFLAALTAWPAFADETGSQFTSFAGLELGTVTLAQIQEKLGPAKLVETGDAAEYEASICYRTSGGLLIFLSGEMGGPEHQLLGFAVSSRDRAKACPNLPAKNAPLRLQLAGLYLGMTKEEFKHVVATKVEWDGNIGRAFFQSKRLMTPTEFAKLPKNVQQATLAGNQQNYFDVSVSVIGTFAGENLTEFRVWKVETL